MIKGYSKFKREPIRRPVFFKCRTRIQTKPLDSHQESSKPILHMNFDYFSYYSGLYYCLNIFFSIFYFHDFEKEGGSKERERESERASEWDRDLFAGSFSNDCKDWDWARVKPGAYNFIWISCMEDRGLRIQAINCCFLGTGSLGRNWIWSRAAGMQTSILI